MNQNIKLTQIIHQAIDLHVHVGPEVVPRKFSVAELVEAQRNKLAGAVTKNHFYPTAFATASTAESNFLVIPGLVLNNFVGGLNPDAIYATSLIAKGPFVVWLPTVHAEQFLQASMYEVAPEWVADKSLTLRSAKQVKPVYVTKNNRLTPAARRAIDSIAATGAVLATGHIAWQEAELVVDYAKRAGVLAIIITHPIYQHIRMPIDIQKRLAAKGCFIEHCYSMYKLDGIAIAEIAHEIKIVGAHSVVLTSDVGQAFSPNPDEALLEFCELLLKEGLSFDELGVMLVRNPRRILGIPDKTTYNT